MARISALDRYALDLRKAAVTLAVVAAHVAVIIVMLRSAGHSADVVDITLFSLPISPEDRMREPVHVQKPPISRVSEAAHRRAALAREPALRESSRIENTTSGDAGVAHVGVTSEPVPPIDWYAEIETSANALEQHDNVERGRRSLAGSKLPELSAAPQKPVCPFEKCEPGWGENLGIFKQSLHSKAGRIETIPNDRTTLPNGSQNMSGSESVLWINNWCYSILVSSDPQRRGLYKCFFPLGGTSAARGDLFDHMNESRPPQSHYTDTPWISYGLTLGAAPDRRKAP